MVDGAMRAAPFLLVPVLLVAACGGGLKLTLIDGSVQRPGNVAVYFTVDKKNGEPVAGLAAESFAISEDGQPVSVLESRQTILNPEVVAAHYTLLLVDMSGSVADSGDVPVIVDASKAFAQRLDKLQKVAVYAFDGSPDVYAISGFGGGPSLSSAIDRLATFRPRDPSTNLNGGIIQALNVLGKQMHDSSAPLTFGTLVVFTDGTDRAARVPRAQLHQALDAATVEILVVGVGSEIDNAELSSIGRDGAILTRDRGQIAASFEAAAAKVEAASRRYYLLGYCSPARAGEHEVTVEAHADGRSGELRYKFDARGFGPGCDPKRPPSFNIRRPRPPAPPPSSGRF